MSLRIGFVGAGQMSQQHAKRLAKIPHTEVVAVCHPRPANARKFVEAQPGEVTVFTEAETMFQEAALDALYVCVPPFAQDDTVEKAVDQGLHVFLEKPIALEVPLARRMVEAAEANQVVTQVGFQFRFREGVRRLKAAMNQGETGQPTLFSGRYWTHMDGNPWWRDRTKSGGQVVEQLIHIYDLAAHFMGPADLEKTTGYLANLCHGNRPDYTIEDTSVGVHRMQAGGVSVITGSNNALPMHFIGDFRVVCENGMLDYHSSGQSWVNPDRSTLYLNGEKAGDWDETGDVTLALNEDFIKSIQAGHPAEIPIRDGLRALEWVQAVVDAS